MSSAVQRNCCTDTMTACQKTRTVPIRRDKPRPTRSGLNVFSGVLKDPDPALRQNAYIMRTKCAQKREPAIVNPSATITYNFDPLKCTHFLVIHPGNRHSKILNLKSNDPDESGRSQNTPFTTNVTTATYKTVRSIRPDNTTVQHQ